MLKIKECRVFMKVCSDCGQLKLIKRFSKRGEGKRRKYCTKCERERKKKHKRVCKNCGQEFLGLKTQEYCCRECKDKSQLNQVEFFCENCGKPSSKKYKTYNSSNHHFCSQECRKQYMKEHSNKHIINCDCCGQQIEVNHSRYKQSKHHFCSYKCMAKWQSENWIRENHPLWKPELTEEDRRINGNRLGVSNWRKDVYERDKYTCQCCGKQGGWGVRLNAHHLNGWNWDIEHRLDVNNGATLCQDCHLEFHKIYGKGNNTKEQFEEYLQQRNKDNNDVA